MALGILPKANQQAARITKNSYEAGEHVDTLGHFGDETRSETKAPQQNSFSGTIRFNDQRSTIPVIDQSITISTPADVQPTSNQGFDYGNWIGAAMNVVDKTGNAASSAIEYSTQTASIVGELMVDIAGMGPKPLDEKAQKKQAEDIQAMNSRIAWLEDLASRTSVVSYQDALKNALTATGKTELDSGDKNRLSFNASYSGAQLTRAYYQAEYRRARQDDENAARGNQKSQSVTSTSKGMAVNMNAMAEGGTGGAKTNLSASAGAG